MEGDYQMFSSSSAWSPPQQTFTNSHGGLLGFMEMKKENAITNNTSSSKSAADELPRDGGQAEDQAAGSSGFVNAGSEDKKKRGNINGKKVRKPKYAFQTRSPVDILDDGYRWRKYGQKAVKNNKFPRSYYRCTHQGCSVKKQVQRLSRDESVVVTTYEGVHSHPIEKPSENFEHILSQMQIYTPF